MRKQRRRFCEKKKSTCNLIYPGNRGMPESWTAVDSCSESVRLPSSGPSSGQYECSALSKPYTHILTLGVDAHVRARVRAVGKGSCVSIDNRVGKGVRKRKAMAAVMVCLQRRQLVAPADLVLHIHCSSLELNMSVLVVHNGMMCAGVATAVEDRVCQRANLAPCVTRVVRVGRRLNNKQPPLALVPFIAWEGGMWERGLSKK